MLWICGPKPERKKKKRIFNKESLQTVSDLPFWGQWREREIKAYWMEHRPESCYGLCLCAVLGNVLEPLAAPGNVPGAESLMRCGKKGAYN